MTKYNAAITISMECLIYGAWDDWGSFLELVWIKVLYYQYIINFEFIFKYVQNKYKTNIFVTKWFLSKWVKFVFFAGNDFF